jgi:transposase-like protein
MASKKMARKPRAKRKAATEKKPRKQFTPEQRAAILAEATEQKLTGKQVAEKHGISMVTYYLWRQKSGGAKRRGRRSVARVSSGDGLGPQLRAAVQGRIHEMLPGIVQQEVASYLDGVLGSGPRRRKGR